MSPSRRSVLSLCGLAVTGTIAGCTVGEKSKSVDVLLQNDDTEERQLAVAVEQDDEEVYRAKETIPPDDGTNLGEVLLEDAFEGASGDQFTVETWLEGKSSGTFDYEITCPDENRFSLLIEHRPYDAGDGNPIDYVADRCEG